MANTKTSVKTTLPVHGAAVLPSVTVDAYNCEPEDGQGFVGDKASKTAFHDILDKFRRAAESDPFGNLSSEDIGKKKLAATLSRGDAEAAAAVHGAVEDFSRQLAGVIKKFLRLKAWRDTQSIVIGGGFRAGRIGELAIARTALLLKEADLTLGVWPIHSDPDEAGLIGAAHLLPPWMLEGHDGILAVDVGGTNIRSAIVQLNLTKASNLSKATVLELDLWRHKDDDPTRDRAVARLTEMLSRQAKHASKAKLSLAPVVGIACPGVIEPDGSIARGAQNLPGNWESSKFNLPAAVSEALPTIGEHQTLVVMHNDAVVQGLSELPHICDQKRWGVLTIGTGLGNARFTMGHKLAK